MKFYTPELLQRFASPDEQIALAAQDELEARSEQYAEHLKSIAKKLPPRFRELQERYYLHDARIVTPFFPWFPPYPYFHPEMFLEMMDCMRRSDRCERLPSLMLALELDAPPKEVIVLHYRGVRPEKMFFEPWRHPRYPALEWRHDEIDLVPTDGQVEFVHSILFTDAFELRLQFADFDFNTLKPMTAAASTDNSRTKAAS